MHDTKIAFLVANEGIERVELTGPWDAVTDAGYQPVLLAPEAGDAELFDHLDRVDAMPAEDLHDAGSADERWARA